MMDAAVHAAFPRIACDRAGSVRAALEAVDHGDFDLALVDLSLGDGRGVDVIRRIAETQPHCAIVVATIHDDDAHLFEALQAGAQGYLLKDHPCDWIARQLRGIADGQPPLSPGIARRLLRHFRLPAPPPALPDGPSIPRGAGCAQPGPGGALSLREIEVLGLLAQGERIADIAARLKISRHTVGDHVKSIYRKLNITSRAEAALRARSMGLA